MKNYYEILEVDKNASQEVIEKAYRTLAKKYHPDLQQGTQKQECAEKMKMINDAYDVLSDDSKRQEYNETLKQELENETISKEEHEKIIQENYKLKEQINQMEFQQTQQPKNSQIKEDTIIKMTRILNEQVEDARRQAYHDAYIQDLKNRGYKIKYKHDIKYYLKQIMVIAIVILICFIIYQIPPVKNFFIELYNENIIFQAIVDIFKNTFSSTF